MRKPMSQSQVFAQQEKHLEVQRDAGSSVIPVQCPDAVHIRNGACCTQTPPRKPQRRRCQRRKRQAAPPEIRERPGKIHLRTGHEEHEPLYQDPGQIRVLRTKRPRHRTCKCDTADKIRGEHTKVTDAMVAQRGRKPGLIETSGNFRSADGHVKQSGAMNTIGEVRCQQMALARGENQTTNISQKYRTDMK